MPASLPVPLTYAALRQAVNLVMVKGQHDIERAKVRTYWETGRLIRSHLLANKERADYGAGTVQRLADDIGIDVSVLQRCARFAECFPIVATWPQLTWAHFRLLVPVDDPKLRRSLATEANRHRWPVVRLEQRIRALRPLEAAPAAPATGATAPQKALVPRRGVPGVCRVVAVGPGLAVDLGFACFLDLPDGTEARARAGSPAHQAGDFVQVDAAGHITVAPGATKADLFTYAAVILKVVDGDTLWVKIFLRPGHWVKQKLRLRDLDAPELSTPEGRAAKRFVDGLLPEGAEVTVGTTKPDKYDRYLADVFVPRPGDKGPDAGGGEVFLNNALLAAGHAVPKKAWEFSDWAEA